MAGDRAADACVSDQGAALGSPSSRALASSAAIREVSIVDDAAEVMPPPAEGLLTHEEQSDLHASMAERDAARSLDTVAGLKLSVGNVQRAQEIRGQFDVSEDPSEVGEQLLHDLVAGELAIAMQLQDVEAAMASLLGRTVADPRLAIEVAKGLREAMALSGAIRRRMEGSLSAAAALRAQRLLLAAQRGRNHV